MRYLKTPDGWFGAVDDGYDKPFFIYAAVNDNGVGVLYAARVEDTIEVTKEEYEAGMKKPCLVYAWKTDE